MFYLTEQQRLEAIAVCDRIQELCKKNEQHLRNILEIFDRMAKRKPEAADGRSD